MSPSLFHVLNISQTSMMSQLQDLDITSDNLANTNTNGYKANRGNFQELLSNNLEEGIRLNSTQLSMNQGSLIQSANNLSLAIEGEGFFGVTLPDGTIGYTRNGDFSLDATNQIVNGNGYPLVWDGEVPEGTEEVAVSSSGVVSALQNSTWTEVGTISTYRFANPTALQAFGGNMYVPSLNSGEAVAGTPGSGFYGAIQSQYLESSNVNVAGEMTHLIELQRAFQMSTNVFDQTNNMISLAINLRKG